MFMYNKVLYEKFNPVKNQYDYLIDNNIHNKHNNLTYKTKKISFLHGYSYIRINITGIKEQEFKTAYTYINTLMNGFSFKNSVKNVKSSLKSLKEIDPKLYDLKRLYNTNALYSKLCQGDKQPVIYDSDGKNRVKYKNFTTGEDNYYGCTSDKYPYINFIVNSHPEKFCIPCCYKLNPKDNEDDKKNKIFKECIKTNTYVDDSLYNKKTRHILTYGKMIFPGRLSKLPEDTLEGLFYDTYSKSVNGIDKECETDKGYFIFGVIQNLKNIQNVGILFCISHSLNKNIINFIEETIIKINDNDTWKLLLDGNIISYFETKKLLVSTLYHLFVEDNITDLDIWDSLFYDIALHYWDIDIIQFVDNKSADNDDNSIVLDIPSNITNYDDVITNKKKLILIRLNKKEVYPIYIIEQDLYFRYGNIYKKLYNNQDKVVLDIINIYDHYFNNNYVQNKLDLSTLSRALIKTKYKVVKYYINIKNKCYGVDIKINNIKFYLPILYSSFKFNDVEVDYKTKNKQLPSWLILNKFMKIINRDIKYITIDKWILYDKKVIGFLSDNINIYIKPITIKRSKEIKICNYFIMYYDIFDINDKIVNNNKPVLNKRDKTISKSLYNVYLYKILCMQFINYKKSLKNVTIRNKIKDVIKNLKISNNNLNELGNILLGEYVDDYINIRNIIKNYIDNININSDNIVFKNKKFNTSKLLDVIDNTHFNFDNKIIDSMILLDNKSLEKKLYDIFKKITINKIPDFSNDFPNILEPCKDELFYCNKKKLLINDKNLKELITFIAIDMKNELKYKYMFNDLLIFNNINYFNFINRNYEHIDIYTN